MKCPYCGSLDVTDWPIKKAGVPLLCVGLPASAVALAVSMNCGNWPWWVLGAYVVGWVLVSTLIFMLVMWLPPMFACMGCHRFFGDEEGSD